MSKKFVAEAWIAMRYSWGFGVGSGMSVTLRSFGPYGCLIRMARMHEM